jgi:hypothetical protein
MLAAGILTWEHKQTTAYNYLTRVLQQKIKEKAK